MLQASPGLAPAGLLCGGEGGKLLVCSPGASLGMELGKQPASGNRSWFFHGQNGPTESSALPLAPCRMT